VSSASCGYVGCVVFSLVSSIVKRNGILSGTAWLNWHHHSQDRMVPGRTSLNILTCFDSV